MKIPVAVTIDDLEATAKDDRKGLYFHRYLKIYWDDATNNFTYQYKTRYCNRAMVIDILNEMAKQK